MNIKNYLSQHLRETDKKSDIVYVGIVAGSVLLSVFWGLNLLNSYRDAVAVQEQESEMRDFLTSYNQKVDALNKEQFRPISDIELDEVQSKLLFSAQVNNLELTSLRNLSLQDEQAKEHGKSFDMDLLGTWSNTVSFLENFGVKNTLISIRNIRLTPEQDGRVKTILEYKIYTK